VAVDKRLLNVASRVQRRGRGGGYGFAMATNQKPEVEVPSDQPPSYQLEIEDIVEGEGDEAVAGKIVEVHYVGVSWKNGKQFDASRDRGDAFKFSLGKGQVRGIPAGLRPCQAAPATT
jgi:FKBP-type peptidyl-prolyl cis-trans isomerase